MQHRKLWIAWAAALNLLAASACNQTSTSPDEGVLVVRVRTTGGDFDTDGYTLLLDGQFQKSLLGFQTVRIAPLSRGSHTVRLAEVAENCDVQQGPERSIEVVSSSQVEVEFLVECFATGVVVSNVTTGIDIGPGYGIRIDGGAEFPLSVNATAPVSRLSPGRHSVALVLDPSFTNCQVAPAGGYDLEVASRTLVPVSFVVSCTARYGSIQVSVETSGADVNWGAYQVQLNDGALRPLDASGNLVIDQLAAGDYVVRLILPSHCTMSGTNAPTVAVQTGGLTRQVSTVRFQVSCTELERTIAFTRWPYESPHWGYDPFVALAREDGSAILLLSGGYHPSWSPDGIRLAFIKVNTGCYYGCPGQGIHLIKRDKTGLLQLTADPQDANPVWSPSGDRIAFTRNTMLWLMDADGSDQAPLILPQLAVAREPAWSPDGTRLAFTCAASFARSDICTVKPDGTGLTTLTNGTTGSWSPVWSPDGNSIAFVTSNNTGQGLAVALMNADGSGVIRLTDGETPAWSPDGTRIMFSRNFRLYVINRDGSGLLQLTDGQGGGDHDPVWRR